MAAGVGMPVRETFEAALRMGAQALQALGDDAGEAAQVIERVRELDAQRLALEVALADPLAGNELLFGNAGQPQPVPSPVRSAVPGGRIHSPTRCRSGLTAWAESGTIGVRSAPAADES